MLEQMLARPPVPRLALLTAVALLFAFAAQAAAQTADNVLLVVNEKHPDSVEIGKYYAAKRSLPADHIVSLSIPNYADSISRTDFETLIEYPLTNFLTRNLLQDRILYIVLTKGVPLRIGGTGGMQGTVASVDSELTLLYRRMTGARTQIIGRIDNPYFLGAKPLAEAKRLTRETSDLYLVTRLDGFTLDDVKKLIDRGASPATVGVVVLDQRTAAADRGGDAWLKEAADVLEAAGKPERVQLDSGKGPVTAKEPVLGYFSWGSNDPANQRRKLGLNFSNGAIAAMFVDADGRTFKEPTAGWTPSVAGSLTGPTLAGDLIREGITGLAAHVMEPYLDGTVRPQVLFPAYLSGFNLAEAYYLATPYLSWQNIVIGDPLCAPFPKTPIDHSEIQRGIDRETELPAFFSMRRLDVLKGTGLNIEALKLNMRVVSLVAQGRPESEVEALLKLIVELEPRLGAFPLRMAIDAENAGDSERAEVMYRAIIGSDPENFVALNNLAYLLAEKKKAYTEALPLALKAYSLSGQSAIVSDTLGWIYFKMNDKAAALPLLEQAVTKAPNQIDIRIHAAIVNADMGNLGAAKAHLDAALKVDPKATARPDVKELISRIK